MRARFLAAAAIGALLTSPAFAQDATTGAGAMNQEDIQELGQTFEQAGFTGFRPVTGGQVFRGMGAGGDAAVIAVAPEMGNTAGGTGAGADATGDGMTDARMFQVTTAEGRTLYVVVPPEMTGMGTTGTTGDATGGGTDSDTTQTAETTGDADNDEENNAGDAATTTADNDAGETTGDNADAATTADNDAAGTTGDNADATATADTDAAGTTGDNAGNGEAMTMNIDLSGRQQVPPVETSGQGEVQVTFNSDSRELSWKLDYSDLSSDATAAHFHGPADPGETAPPVIPVEDFSDGAEGSATLTEEQAEQLMAGKMYFNLHTENNPNGELRGQVTAVQ